MMSSAELERLEQYRVQGDAHVIRLGTTALLVIDMVYASVHPDYGWVKMYRQMGLEAACDYYVDRLYQTVVPNLQELQKQFRHHAMPVVFTTVASEREDFGDWPARVRRRIERWTEQGFDHPYVHEWDDTAGVIDELAPREGDQVINKTRFSAFNGSNIDAILRELGAELLIVTGVGTNFCVQCTLLDAYDYGYECILVEDATATLDPDMQEIAVRSMELYARTTTTHELLTELAEAIR
jgi:nicotinamidase-related amidase